MQAQHGEEEINTPFICFVHCVLCVQQSSKTISSFFFLIVSHFLYLSLVSSQPSKLLEVIASFDCWVCICVLYYYPELNVCLFIGITFTLSLQTALWISDTYSWKYYTITRYAYIRTDCNTFMYFSFLALIHQADTIPNSLYINTLSRNMESNNQH